MPESFQSKITAKRHEKDQIVEEVEVTVRGVYADKSTMKVIWRALALRGFDHIEAVGESVQPRVVRELDEPADTSPSFET